MNQLPDQRDVLSNPRHFDVPFPHFLCASAFDAESLKALERTFSNPDWQHRDGAFYRCFLREITQELPRSLLGDVVGRMRAITGLPLLDEVQVTAQRVEPGQAIGVHSDEPLLGYELVRLVVLLNPSWEPNHGGVLQLFESRDGGVKTEVEPRHNAAFGFLLHEGSFHGVTEARRSRRSVVFNFWHVANSPELGEEVRAFLGGAQMSELPSALDGVMAEAEATLPEEATFRAGLAALSLHRWGYDVTVVEQGYRRSLGMPVGARLTDEGHAAVLLADWVARLHQEPFDLVRWNQRKAELGAADTYSRISRFVRLCFPATT